MSRLQFIISIALTLAAITASAQTVIPGGDVSGIWNAAGSPYLIQGTITVPASDTLLIEPDVDVIFYGNYSFLIYGFLQAEGAEGDSIFFAAIDTSVGWRGIRFFSAADSCRLYYCIIQDGRTSGNGLDSFGGGIFCESSNLVIRHSSIRFNATVWEPAGDDGCGGGLSIIYSDLVLDHCDIISNSALGDGGGIYLSCSDMTMDHCILAGNELTHSYKKGGGIYAWEAGVDIEDCTFEANSAPIMGGNGGAICMRMGSNFNITSSSFIDNSVEINAGAINIWEARATIAHCTFRGNSAFGYGGQGGALICSTPLDVTLSYCEFIDNFAYLGSGIYLSDAPLIIDHCTFSRNTSVFNDCVIMGWGTNLSIVNGIFAGNTGGGIELHLSPDASITYTDFYNNEGGNFQGSTLPAGIGELVTTNANGDSCDIYSNIYLDPCFVDTSFCDYRLHWGSPCIDAGDPDPLYFDPDGTIADMGNYFYDQSAPVRILLTPHHTPIEIPPEGGSFDYTVWLTNIDPAVTQFNVWMDATVPSGTVFGPLLGPITAQLDSGVTIDRERTQSVSMRAPEGLYAFNAYAVAGSDTSRDSFGFKKQGFVSPESLTGWYNTGEPFNDIPSSWTRVHNPVMRQIAGNHPNPFNPSTVISYQLSVVGHVNLSVYDISGRKVAELVNGWRDAGAHEITFDASGLASGVYLYRLTTGNFTTTGKLILMK
jgi:hypothetical protein